MDEKLSIIKKLNNEPLGQFAKKLLDSENEAITDDELYIVQVARQITENYYVLDYIRKSLLLQTYDKLLTDLYDLYEKEPLEQMELLVNDEGNGSREDLMKCTELHQMALVIMQTLIDRRE